MDLIENWITFLRTSGLRENTILAYSRDIQKINQCLDGVEVKNATSNQLRSAYDILNLGGISTTSLKRMHCGIQKYFCFLEQQHIHHSALPGLNLLSTGSPSFPIKQTKRILSSRQYNAKKYPQLADPNYLRQRYCTFLMGTEEIAAEVGCTKQAVFKALRAHGIESRSHSQAWWASAEKAYTKTTAKRINEEFFSEWSPAAAYVLGVIFTDGNLALTKASDGSMRFGSGRVSISQKEPELLEKVGKLIDYSGKMHFQPRREYRGRNIGELYTISFSSDRVFADLIRFGLLPRKSLKIQFPAMPVKMRRHFIRGCWDGDGSVYIDKRSERITASFISGSLSFIKGMIAELGNANFQIKTIYTHNRKTPSYYFRLTGRQVPRFYHYLYDNVPSTQYLDRKFKLFRRSLEMNSLDEKGNVRNVRRNVRGQPLTRDTSGNTHPH